MAGEQGASRGNRIYDRVWGREVIKNLSIEGRMTDATWPLEVQELVLARLLLIKRRWTTLKDGHLLQVETCGYVLRGLEKLGVRPNANFDRTVIIDGSKIEPQVTWGTRRRSRAGLRVDSDPTLETDPTKKGNLEQGTERVWA